MEFVKEGHIVFFILLNITYISFSSQVDNMKEKIDNADKASLNTYNSFVEMFFECINSRMPHMPFLIDNVQKFVNYPSKTTVGLAPKFTSNRKFFANMITTRAFKEMLAKDGEEIWNDYIKKLRYCDEVVMDQDLLKEFYDREVDQSKL